MDFGAFIAELIAIVVGLAIIYIIAKAIFDYVAAPWSAVALKVVGLLCLLVVAMYILQAMGGLLRVPKIR